jgi:hypothetical protein
MLSDALFKKMLVLIGLSFLFVACSLYKPSTGRLRFVTKANCLSQRAVTAHDNIDNAAAVATIVTKKQELIVPFDDSVVLSQSSVNKVPIQVSTISSLKNAIELKKKQNTKGTKHKLQTTAVERSNSEKLKAAKNAFLAESIIYAVLSVLSLPFSLLILTWGGSIFGFVITALGVAATILSIALFIRAKKLLTAYKEYEAHQQDYYGVDAAAKPKMKGDPTVLYVLSRVGLVPIVLVFTLIVFTLLIL